MSELRRVHRRALHQQPRSTDALRRLREACHPPRERADAQPDGGSPARGDVPQRTQPARAGRFQSPCLRQRLRLWRAPERSQEGRATEPRRRQTWSPQREPDQQATLDAGALIAISQGAGSFGSCKQKFSAVRLAAARRKLRRHGSTALPCVGRAELRVRRYSSQTSAAKFAEEQVPQTRAVGPASVSTPHEGRCMTRQIRSEISAASRRFLPASTSRSVG